MCPEKLTEIKNCYISESVCFAWWQAFKCLSHASSGLLASPPMSCDRLDYDHMTAGVHRRPEEACKMHLKA